MSAIPSADAMRPGSNTATLPLPGVSRWRHGSIVLGSAAVFSMSFLPGSLVALGTLCFVVGVAGSGTSIIGCAGVLPHWFGKRLGLALGLTGLGAVIGIGLSPFVVTLLIAARNTTRSELDRRP